MKKINKFVSMLLVVAMIFAMSITAFATGNSTATIQVLYYGEPVLNTEPVSFAITANMTAKDALDNNASGLNLVWKQVTNLNPSFGSTAYAIDEILYTGSAPLGAASGIQAQYWSSSYAGYGVEYTTVENGETVYHFIYVGEDWQFRVNGSKPIDSNNTMEDGTPYELYMDQYTVQPGDDIVVSYEQVIERWTGTYNWLANT